MDKLTNEMIVALANDLGLEPALLKAVQLVEGAGRDGFLVDGRPQILFEGHIMYKEIKNKFGLDKSVAAQKSYPTICFPKWDKSKYLGGANHLYCGCKDVFEFVKKMQESHESQLKLMYYYMNNTSCLKNLKEHDWAGFARKYNGPGYAENAYDQKLKNAYENFKNKI